MKQQEIIELVLSSKSLPDKIKNRLDLTDEDVNLLRKFRKTWETGLIDAVILQSVGLDQNHVAVLLGILALYEQQSS